MPIDPNLRLRILSSLVLAPLVLLAIYVGGWIYALTVTAVMALGMCEWLRLNASDIKWKLLGIPYLGGSGLALIYLRELPDIGMGLGYFLIAAVWGTDIGAYAAGKLIGGPKLAPVISPHKTWAGLFGGMALAVLFGYGVATAMGARQLKIAIGLALLLAIAAQAGDLFKSVFKRRAGVKESGNVIPGHGGVLDRIDGLIFAGIVLALFEATGGRNLAWW
jgi:phosphatidate cytidylyltransferase